MVGDALTAVFIIEKTILVKEIKEYSGCDKLVYITETVDFGDKVKGVVFLQGASKHPRHQNCPSNSSRMALLMCLPMVFISQSNNTD